VLALVQALVQVRELVPVQALVQVRELVPVPVLVQARALVLHSQPLLSRSTVPPPSPT